MRIQPGVQRDASHPLHRDPQHVTLIRGTEAIDVRRVQVVELCCELRLAQEALARVVVGALRAQNLDHHLALQQGLLAAVHRPVAALPDQLAQDVLAQRGPREIALVHRRWLLRRGKTNRRSSTGRCLRWRISLHQRWALSP